MMSKKTRTPSEHSVAAVLMLGIIPLMLVGVLNARPETDMRAQAAVFPDLDPGSQVGQAAARMKAKGIIDGFPDGSFRPEEPVNRAQAAKILLGAAELPLHELTNDGYFTDVKDGEWYVEYVLTAAGYRVVDGYPDFSFKPAGQINTAEFLKMLTNALLLDTNLPSTYVDVPSGAWFAQYAGIAERYRLFPTRDGVHLEPERLLTRGDVIVAVDRALNKGVDPADPLRGAAGPDPSAQSSAGIVMPPAPPAAPASSEQRSIAMPNASLPSGIISAPNFLRPTGASKSKRSSASSVLPYNPETSGADVCNGRPECGASSISSSRLSSRSSVPASQGNQASSVPASQGNQASSQAPAQSSVPASSAPGTPNDDLPATNSGGAYVPYAFCSQGMGEGLLEIQISTDGNVVAWGNELGGSDPSYVYDLTTHRATALPGHLMGMSRNGRFFVLRGQQSYTSFLLFDRLTAVTSALSLGDPLQADVSDDGRYVVYGDNADFYTKIIDRAAGTSTIVPDSPNYWARSRQFSMSADGRYIAYRVHGSTMGFIDVKLYDRVSGTAQTVNVDTQGAPVNAQPTGVPAISADGRYVLFRSERNMGSYMEQRVNVYDRTTGVSREASAYIGIAGDWINDAGSLLSLIPQSGFTPQGTVSLPIYNLTNASTLGTVALSYAGMGLDYPAWNGDGSRVAFTLQEGNYSYNNFTRGAVYLYDRISDWLLILAPNLIAPDQAASVNSSPCCCSS